MNYTELENNAEITTIGANDTSIIETSTDDAISADDAVSADTSTGENTESESLVGGADDESVTISTEGEPKSWPEGGVDSFTNHALPSLVFGMLGIFLVLGLIAISTITLNKLFPGVKKEKKKNENKSID